MKELNIRKAASPRVLAVNYLTAGIFLDTFKLLLFLKLRLIFEFTEFSKGEVFKFVCYFNCLYENCYMHPF